MKQIAIVLAMLLMGCEPYTEKNTKFDIPAELKDCVFFNMYDGTTHAIVVRCPRSETSVAQKQKCGRNCSRDIVTVTTEE